MRNWLVAHYDVLKDFAAPTISFLALIATVTVALIGLTTFNRWRRQKIEERRIDVAIRALAAVYKARFVFENIRSPMAFPYEWEEMPKFPGDDDNKRGQRGSFYAILKRMEAHKDFFERTWELQAECTAVFGQRAEEAFLLMHRARRAIEVSAGMLMRDPYPTNPTEDNKKTWDRFHADVWPHYGDVYGIPDQVGAQLGDFRKQMEDLCRPIVDQGFDKDPRIEWRVKKSYEALDKMSKQR